MISNSLTNAVLWVESALPGYKIIIDKTQIA